MTRADWWKRAVLALLGVAALAASITAQQRTTSPAATPPPARPALGKPKPVLMAAVDPVLLKGLNYRLVGPSRGGRVTAVTGVPSQPKTFYLGVASGGVFRTIDGGLNWTPITDGQIPLGSIGCIAVADSNPDIIYVGTGSDSVRSNVSTGRGIYKSADGGRTWTFAGLREAGQTGALRIHPANPDIVVAAMTGDVFKPNSERGIFKSVDGGTTWTKTLYLNDQVGAMDVEFQPGNPNVVYAWMSRLERKPWTIISGGTDGGFYKSVNGGDTFSKIANGLPAGLIGKGNLATTAANPNRLYALVEALPGGGLYRSDDAGLSWALVNSTPGLIQRPFYYTTLGADPTNADVLYAGAETFYKSVDGGKTVAPLRTPHTDNHDIWISPSDGQTMIQANDGGANVSFDGGRTWSTQMNQVTGEFYAVTADNAFPYKIYGAQQDDSTVIISSVADPFRLSDWKDGPGCETGPIFPHPKDPNTIYGSCKGQYELMDVRTGQIKSYWIGGQSLYGNAGSELIYRFQRVSPMNTSPFDPDVLYYGSQYVHRTRDKGVTWERISPDLTAFPPCCQGVSGEPITRDVTGEEFYSTLYAISESPLERGVIWTGANDGPFSVTRDNGLHWTRITPKDLPEGGRVAFIDPSPHRRGSAYYAVYRYLLGDYEPYIYKTDDYGRTWKRLTDGRNGIPNDTPTRVVREDPNREGLLYAGTEFGMYISFDDGGHWQPFFQNMPQVPINDIKIHNKDLLVATQGRAFWIMDDLSVLHQLTPTVARDAVRLFAPRDGYRTRVSPATLGPTFDYFLPSSIQGAVQIEVLDAKGAIVNSYDSESAVSRGRGARGSAGTAATGEGAAGDSSDPESPAFGRRGAGVQTRATKEAGINRVAWNLLNREGVTMPPGSYQVRLTANGSSQTQPFRVLIDPNVAATGVTAADLAEQYQHILNMRTFTQQVNDLVTRVRTAREAARGGSAERLAAIEKLYSQLVTWPEGVRYNRPGLQAHAQYLAGLGTRTDQKVGRDAFERLAELKKDYARLSAEADKVIGK